MDPAPPAATKKNVTKGAVARHLSLSARGRNEQRPRRLAEHQRRTRVAWGARRVKEAGGTYREVAQRLGVSDQTLRRWRTQRLEDAMRWRGRRPTRTSRELRQALLDDLKENGFQLSVESLQQCHRSLAKREVIDLVRRARAVMSRRGRYRRTESWQRAGSAWSLDHTDEDGGRKAPRLVVRDLAARKNLAAEAVPDKQLGGVIATLDTLIEKHGAPLVIRADGAFAGKRMGQYLGLRGVMRWVTRPGSPWENGAVERANGDLKRRVKGLEEVTSEELRVSDSLFARALEQSNRRVHPRDFGGRTPQEVWAARRRIQPDERVAFQERFNSILAEESCGLYCEAVEEKIRVEVERGALERALIELGYLKVRSVRITPPISTRRAIRIPGV